MDLSQVVYANLAKCRQQLGKGSAETLAVYCQQQFPVAELVGVVRPAAVLVCMLGADPSRGQVSWEAPDWRQLVYACHGYWSTNVRGSRRSEW